MYLIFLTFLLFIMLITALYFAKGDLLNPLFVSIASFYVVSLIAMFGFFAFGCDISLVSLCVILGALLVFALGFLPTSLLRLSNKEDTNTYYLKFNQSSVLYFVLFIISIICFFVVYISISRQINVSNIFTMFDYIRNQLLFTDFSLGTIPSFASLFVVALGDFCTYCLINLVVSKNILNKFSVFYMILTIFIGLLTSSLSTGRTFIIQWAVLVAVFSYFSWVEKYSIHSINWKHIRKILFYLSITFIIVFILFELLGILTNKTKFDSLFSQIFEYSGAALPAFDIYLDNNIALDTFASPFGQETFANFYNILNKFGLNFDVYIHKEFVYFNTELKTNIYTSLRSYIHDFSFIGMFVWQFLIGIIVGIFNNLRNKKNCSNPLYVLIYGMVIYGLFMQAWKETLFLSIFSVSSFGSLFFFFILYKLFIKRKVVSSSGEQLN